MSFLKIESLTKSFCKGDVCVARSIDLEVGQGEIFTLLGKSGSGKSTLLRMIAGLETPDSGEISLDGKTLFGKKKSIEPKDRQLSMVFQNYALFPHMNIEENILFGVKKEAKRDIEGIMKTAGIEDIKKRFPHEISGGQQQRVSLCRAVISKPKLLLLDEPFSNIDPDQRITLRHEIRELIKTFDTTALFVTHDKEDAYHMSDRAAIIKEGEILQRGSMEDLYCTPYNRYCARFLGKVNILQRADKTYALRPEDIKIGDMYENKGEVIASIFHGFYSEIEIESYGERLLAYSTKPLKVGSVVGFETASGVELRE